MPRRCPLCKQTLPAGIDEHELRHRTEQLLAPSLSDERQRLAKEHKQELAEVRQFARREAERNFRQDLSRLKQRANRAEQEKERAVERVRRETERRAERNVAQAVRFATRENVAKMEKLEALHDRDRVRHEADRVRWQGQLDAMSRKLEKQSGEQLGEEGELDLIAQLKAAFRGDRIERIGRGVKGADIIHFVTDAEKEVGRIVYESKNVSTWQNKFITQAKRYQTQYDTPHIIIVTRAFPRKKKGLCIVKDVPIVETRMAVALATIIREGIIEISRLGLSGAARETKAQELFDYIISDKFRTRFAEIAESVAILREHQQKERDWHENAWGTETKLHDKIDARRREIDVQLRTITRAEVRPMMKRAAASA